MYTDHVVRNASINSGVADATTSFFWGANSNNVVDRSKIDERRLIIVRHRGLQVNKFIISIIVFFYYEWPAVLRSQYQSNPD